MDIFIAIVALAFLIFIHELGHFIGARKVGVFVEEFSIGFPPRLIKKIYNGTIYSLSLIPLGGFVKLKGQNLDDENTEEEGNYASKSISQRLLIILGGPVANLLLPFLLMPLVYMAGQKYYTYLDAPPEISSVAENMPASKAGILPGDLIIGINDVKVASWIELNEQIGSAVVSGKVNIAVNRSGRNQVFSFTPEELSQGFGWSHFIPPLVGALVPGLPAEKAGLQTGDIVVSIDGKSINTWEEMVSAINSSQITDDESLVFKIRRGSSILSFDIPLQADSTGRKFIGVSMAETVKSYPFFEAISEGAKKTTSLMSDTLKFIFTLFAGKAGTENLGGPVMITQMVGQAAERGFSDFLFLICFISIQLGIFNLLPFPVLDGGHILLLCIEKLKGSPLSVKFRQTAQTAGFFVLISLAIYVTIQDSVRIFGS